MDEQPEILARLTRERVTAEIDWIPTRVVARLDEKLTYPTRAEKTAALDQVRALLDQVRITATWPGEDAAVLIGPLTAEEWASLRLGGLEEDPLFCCAFTSDMRDELFHLLRMGAGHEWALGLADYFRGLETVCDVPAGHPLIERIRAYYWPDGLPQESDEDTSCETPTSRAAH